MQMILINLKKSKIKCYFLDTVEVLDFLIHGGNFPTIPLQRKDQKISQSVNPFKLSAIFRISNQSDWLIPEIMM